MAVMRGSTIKDQLERSKRNVFGSGSSTTIFDYTTKTSTNNNGGNTTMGATTTNNNNNNSNNNMGGNTMNNWAGFNFEAVSMTSNNTTQNQGATIAAGWDSILGPTAGSTTTPIQGVNTGSNTVGTNFIQPVKTTSTVGNMNTQNNVVVPNWNEAPSAVNTMGSNGIEIDKATPAKKAIGNIAYRLVELARNLNTEEFNELVKIFDFAGLKDEFVAKTGRQDTYLDMELAIQSVNELVAVMNEGAQRTNEQQQNLQNIINGLNGGQYDPNVIYQFIINGVNTGMIPNTIANDISKNHLVKVINMALSSRNGQVSTSGANWGGYINQNNNNNSFGTFGTFGGGYSTQNNNQNFGTFGTFGGGSTMNSGATVFGGGSTVFSGGQQNNFGNNQGMGLGFMDNNSRLSGSGSTMGGFSFGGGSTMNSGANSNDAWLSGPQNNSNNGYGMNSGFSFGNNSNNDSSAVDIWATNNNMGSGSVMSSNVSNNNGVNSGLGYDWNSNGNNNNGNTGMSGFGSLDNTVNRMPFYM